MRRLVLVILTCLVLCAPALASDAQSELYDALDIAGAEEAMPDEARDILGDVGVEDAMEPEGMLSRLADAAWDKLGSLWRPAASAAAKGSGPPAGAKSSGLRLVVRLAVAVISCLSKCSDTQKYSGAVAMGDVRSLSRTKSSAASRAKMIRFPPSPRDQWVSPPCGPFADSDRRWAPRCPARWRRRPRRP